MVRRMALPSRKHALAATLDLNLEDESVYVLGPSSSCTDQSTRTRTTVRGNVALDFPRTGRCLSSLRVHLVGRLTVKDPSGNHAEVVHQTLAHEVDLLYDHSPVFQAGQHRLDFTISLPAATPPTYSCPYGGQSYSLQATLEDHAGQRIASSARQLEILQSPNKVDGEYLLDSERCHAKLGRFSIHVSCRQPTLGSAIDVQLRLREPNPGITFLQVAVAVRQNIHLKPNGGERISGTEKEDTILRAYNTPKGMSPILPSLRSVKKLQPFQRGDSLTYEAVARLPTHRGFCPSTLESTEAPLQVSHSIQVAIRYQLPTGLTKEVQVARDIQLLSCQCVNEAIVAPPYEVKDPNPHIKPSKSIEHCACLISLAEQGLIPYNKHSENATPNLSMTKIREDDPDHQTEITSTGFVSV